MNCSNTPVLTGIRQSLVSAMGQIHGQMSCSNTPVLTGIRQSLVSAMGQIHGQMYSSTNHLFFLLLFIILSLL